MKKTDFIVKIAMEFKNPTQVQMIHLSNTIFVGRPNLNSHSFCMYHVPVTDKITEFYKSTDRLKSVQTVGKLSKEDLSNVYFDIIKQPKH